MLVLKEFRVNESAEEAIYIKGRESGILAFLFSFAGIDPVTTLKCNKDRVCVEEAAIRKGKYTLDIPITAITGVETAARKPFYLLVLTAIFLVLGLLLWLMTESAVFVVVGLILAGICLALYALKKQISFAVYNGGNHAQARLDFGRNVIEGVKVDFAKYEEARALLNKLVLAKQKQNAALQAVLIRDALSKVLAK
jgi:hypothetical protein